MTNRMLSRQTAAVSIDWDNTSLRNVVSAVPSEPSLFTTERTSGTTTNVDSGRVRSYGTTYGGIGPVESRLSATHKYKQRHRWREIEAQQGQNRIENGSNSDEVGNTNSTLYNSNSEEHIGSVAHHRSIDDSNDLNRYGNVARHDSAAPVGEVHDVESAARLARQEILSEEDRFERALQKAIELSKLEFSRDQVRRDTLQEAVTHFPTTEDHSGQFKVQEENIADTRRYSYHEQMGQSEFTRDAKFSPHSDDADTEPQVYAKQLEEALLLSVARDQEYQQRLKQEEKELRMAMTLSIARYTPQHDGLSQNTPQENMGRVKQEDLDGFDAHLNCEPQSQIMKEEQQNQVHKRQAHREIIQEDSLQRDNLDRDFWSAKSMSAHRQEFDLEQTNHEVQQEQLEEERTKCSEEKEKTNMPHWDEKSSSPISNDEISIRLEKQLQETVMKKKKLQVQIEGNLRCLEQYKKSTTLTLGTERITSQVARKHQENVKAELVQQETQHSDQLSVQNKTQQVEQAQEGAETNVGSAIQTSCSMDIWLQKKQIDILTLSNNSDLPVHETTETEETEKMEETGETEATGETGKTEATEETGKTRKTGETTKTGKLGNSVGIEETRIMSNQNTSSMDSWLQKKQKDGMGGKRWSLQSSEVPTLASHQTAEELKKNRERHSMSRLEHQCGSFCQQDGLYESARGINFDSLAVLPSYFDGLAPPINAEKNI